ncbi:Hypothetical_protein [Hexamita inflata]|uniref:Hypothetical_protein n=1 Tax=Hexamita inflata TaxID=28002 RepID=A0AA86TGW6_9EUKA|nr:Hypothetical protein HINF_LOCUS3422 [Hexamita inflata]
MPRCKSFRRKQSSEMRCRTTNTQLNFKSTLKPKLGQLFSTFRQPNQIQFIKLGTVKWNGSEETGESNATHKIVKRSKTKLGQQTQNQNLKWKSSVTLKQKKMKRFRTFHSLTRSTFINWFQIAAKMQSSREWQMLRSFKQILVDFRIQKGLKNGTNCWNQI